MCGGGRLDQRRIAYRNPDTQTTSPSRPRLAIHETRRRKLPVRFEVRSHRRLMTLLTDLFDPRPLDPLREGSDSPADRLLPPSLISNSSFRTASTLSGPLENQVWFVNRAVHRLLRHHGVLNPMAPPRPLYRSHHERRTEPISHVFYKALPEGFLMSHPRVSP